MSSPESSPEWIVSSSSSETNGHALNTDKELIAVASRLWPRVQIHARRELANWNPDDSVALATEVWEGVLQSVSKTLQRRKGSSSGIVDLDAYLFGVFLHRFNRALKRERRRQETIELVPSGLDLEQLSGARDLKSAHDLERSIQVKEAIENMDDWTRKVFAARVYGYSWKEIAERQGLSVQKAKLRFGNALRRLADRLRYRK
jgi:RNA polymerase sigma factor (sigma-70 family)